jgi:RNA polymerase sigma-B factor
MAAQYSPLRCLELFSRYYRNPSLKLRNQLVQLNAGLVRQVAYRLSRQCVEPYEDLEQVGYLGLIRAVERFNPHQGTAFSSFAIPYVRGEILHHLRDKSSVLRIPRRWQELYTKGKNIRKQLHLSLGRPAKEVEVAQALSISLDEWKECQSILQNRALISLDINISHSADYSLTIAETIADVQIQVKQGLEEDRLQLQGAINQLEDRTKAAIESVYLRELPRKEAAKQIGISPMTVTRHLNKGLEQLGLLLQCQAA